MMANPVWRLVDKLLDLRPAPPPTDRELRQAHFHRAEVLLRRLHGGWCRHTICCDGTSRYVNRLAALGANEIGEATNLGDELHRDSLLDSRGQHHNDDRASWSVDHASIVGQLLEVPGLVRDWRLRREIRG